VLILTRQKGREELHIWILTTESLQRGNVSPANPVSRGSECRIYAASHSNHEGNRDLLLSCRRQDNIA
jgi:hypothetical protein